MPTLKAPSLSLSVSTTTIRLAWTDPNPNDAEFELQRKIDAGAFTHLARLGKSATSWTQPKPDVLVDLTLTYRICAVSKRGEFGPWSNSMATIIRPENIPPIFLPPTLTTITFQWNQNPEPEVTGYKLYVGQVTGDQAYDIVDVGNVLTTDYDLLVGTGDWFFTLTAYSATQQSGHSTEVSTTV